MTHIFFNEKKYELRESETVLDCLLRHGIEYPHSCKIGNCQSCLCHSNDHPLEPTWQKGLKPTIAAQGYFLPCIAKPTKNLSLSKPDLNKIAVQAKINDIFYFNHNVLCVRLLVDHLRDWKGGQYLNLINPDQLIRSYSIANLPEQDGYIELHIKIMPTGAMGDWLLKNAKIGTDVHIRGPIGDCFYYNPNHESFPIVLVGTGTGLSPLLGIALDAIDQHHSGQIILIHGGVKSDDLYLHSTLELLAKKHPNFIYKKSTLEQIDEYGSIDKIMLTVLAELKNPVVTVCGPSDTTKMLKTKAFLAGVPSKNIYSDAF